MANSTNKPTIDLSKVRYEAFATILAVAKVLDAAGQRRNGDAFWASAMRLKDNYDQVVELARVYVEVT